MMIKYNCNNSVSFEEFKKEKINNKYGGII